MGTTILAVVNHAAAETKLVRFTTSIVGATESLVRACASLVTAWARLSIVRTSVAIVGTRLAIVRARLAIGTTRLPIAFASHALFRAWRFVAFPPLADASVSLARASPRLARRVAWLVPVTTRLVDPFTWPADASA